MISIICHTNIDVAKGLKWPDKLPARPIVGDLIRSESSTDKKHIELAVCRVTWVKAGETTWGLPVGQWYLDVELWLPSSRWLNLSDFEYWLRQ